jgi:hypothetical protein
MHEYTITKGHYQELKVIKNIDWINYMHNIFTISLLIW